MRRVSNFLFRNMAKPNPNVNAITHFVTSFGAREFESNGDGAARVLSNASTIHSTHIHFCVKIESKVIIHNKNRSICTTKWPSHYLFSLSFLFAIWILVCLVCEREMCRNNLSTFDVNTFINTLCPMLVAYGRQANIVHFHCSDGVRLYCLSVCVCVSVRPLFSLCAKVFQSTHVPIWDRMPGNDWLRETMTRTKPIEKCLGTIDAKNSNLIAIAEHQSNENPKYRHVTFGTATETTVCPFNEQKICTTFLYAWKWQLYTGRCSYIVCVHRTHRTHQSK